VSRASKAAAVAWVVTAVYYFYQYTLRSFPASMAATLIGATQMFGMAGGSAGQFVLLGCLAWILYGRADVLKETGAAARGPAVARKTA
jgi:hypothetical protein